MSKQEINFLAYYDIPGRDEERYAVSAANNLVDYIVTTIIELGYNVNLISASGTKSKTSGYKEECVKVNADLSVHFFKTIPQKNKLYKAISYFLSQYYILRELIKLGENDTIIVYHATSYPRIVRFCKHLKKFNLILYVGEVYSDVSHDNRLKKKEFSIFNCANSYILATEYLDSIINFNNKPSIEVYGDYTVESQRALRRMDDRIHCVYAGTFDKRKGEAQLAVSCAEYLPNNYCLHICGHGSEEDTKEVLDLINSVNRKKKCEVLYHGSLIGEDFIALLQNCDVGLFTPIAEAQFNESDFPSKIISYLSNGLRVVSADVKPVRKSKIGDILWLYKGSNPCSVADTIRRIDFTESYDSRNIINELHIKFKEDLDKLIKGEKINA